jgi:hypothetical protein
MESMATRKKMQRIAICLVLGWTQACFGASSDSAGQKARNPSAGKVVLFRANAMCGPNCLWQVARAYGQERSLQDIAASAGTDPFRGTTLEGMLRACRQMGLPAEAVRTRLDKVTADPRVAVLLLNADNLAHYAILDAAGEQSVRLLDGSQFREMPVGKLKDLWTGVALLIGDPPPRPVAHVGAILRRAGLAIALCAAACAGVLHLVGGDPGRLRRPA